MAASGDSRTTVLSAATRAAVRSFVDEARSTTMPVAPRTVLAVGDAAAVAQVATTIAADLKRDLVRVPLSTVVSGSIGETERHLDQVFGSARKNGSVLLFDEADALFGKRSDVKDSHDRYANLAADLSTRLEAHPGVAILATQRKGNLDDAFTRRLRTVIHVDPLP